MPFASGAHGARIHYEVHGDTGPWVVLVMGVGASSRLWLDVPRQLAEGLTPYRVLTVDNRGTGRSAPLRRPCSLRDMARDVLAAMDAAEIERAFLVGLSMGGMIAQHVALGHAERLDGLVLLATTPGVLHGGMPRMRALRSILRTGVKRLDDPQTAQHLIADLILSRAQRHLADEVLGRVAPAYLDAPVRPEAFAWQLIACALHSTGGALWRICTPTVVVTGDDDIVMGRWSSRVLASRIPGAQLEIVRDAGHGIAFTHPEVIERALSRLRYDLPNTRPRSAPHHAMRPRAA